MTTSKTPILTKEEAIKLYEEHGTLSKIAKTYGWGLERLRQFYINNNIEYKKQVHYTVDETFFDELTEKCMYWLGFLAADGNVSKNKNRISLTLMLDDIDHIKKFKEDIKTDAPIRSFVRKEMRPEFLYDEYDGCGLRFSSKRIKEKLITYNIVPAKSLVITIPNYFFNHQNFNHFIRGMIDGDGGIYLRGQNGSINLSGNPMVVKSIMEFLIKKLELGGNGSFQKHDNRNVSTMGFRRNEDLVKIVNYLYSPDATVWLDRKEIIAKAILKVVPRKTPIKKEDLAATLERTNYNFAETGKIFNCSTLIIRRRARKFGIVNQNAKGTTIYDETIFDQNNENEIQFYLAGYLSQSGTLVEKKSKIVLNNRDKNEIILLYNLFNSPVKLHKRTNSSGFTNYGFVLYNKKIYNDLKRFNINENKRNNYSIPDWLKNHKYLNHFMRGCLDAKSTGGKSKDNRISINITSASEKLMTNIYDIFKEKCNLTTGGNIKSDKKCNSFKIKYSKNAFETIMKYIYTDATIYTQEKRDLAKQLFNI
jgi:hypothetical protein